MASLLSVNVGLPRNLEWQGRTVHTGSWKYPVAGRCYATRAGLLGDGQGDLVGHGGEQRAVLAYQIESYQYWQKRLGRTDFPYGQFSENLTIAGLPDSDVCIGDVYRIGSAAFEVTQPRVTCYRIGIRMSEPRMAALLTSGGRPGFYLRVLEEGYISAGDDIVKLHGPREKMTVQEINALLYSASHPRDRLERAVTIDALAAGWRASFAALLESINAGVKSGNAGLALAATVNAAAPGFRRMSVSSIERESTDVISFFLEPVDGKPLPRARAGQHVVVRLLRAADGPPLVRSYSLSGPPSGVRYRISVKVRPNGVAGAHLRDHVRLGDVLDVSAPHGSFVLRAGDRPVVLLSAGIGATPVLAMLSALSEERSQRPVLWIYATKDGAHHPFASETRHLMRSLAHGRTYICYSSPRDTDRIVEDFDAVGRLSHAVLGSIGIPPTADIYLCGPADFMDQMRQAVAFLTGPTSCVHTESFGGVKSLTPGINNTRQRAPHPPRFESSSGVTVYFARSAITARWKAGSYSNLLELAEDCDVPVRWSCRTGVCHNCESGLVSGSVTYTPEPLDAPANGNLLLCCSRPVTDVVMDL